MQTNDVTVTLTLVSAEMTWTKSALMTRSEFDALPALVTTKGFARAYDEFYSETYDMSLKVACYDPDFSTAKDLTDELTELLEDPEETDWVTY